MKTYAETQNEKPFDWFEALEEAVKNGTDEEQHGRLWALSDNWVTCACGNQCSIIPRMKYGAPEDDKLARLGTIFNEKIQEQKYHTALKLLHRIEKRSAELIKELSQ